MATWVIGDIHGCYTRFMKLLSSPEIKSNDRIILIGDIIDRGAESYKMIQWAMKHISKTGKYQMVCGNHEDNIINDYNRCHHKLVKRWCSPSIRSMADFDIAALDCDYDFVSYMFEAGFETVASVKPIVDWFSSLPLYKKVRVKDKHGKIHNYVIAHAWYGSKLNRDDILWYRDINDFTNELTCDYVPEHKEILIHGHTPTQFIWNDATKSDVYFREHSINIDCGCVFAGGKLAAIRLEDQKVIYA